MTASGSLHPSSSMRMIEIRHELESLGVKMDSFIEKIEFIDALVHARKESSTKTKLPSVSSSSPKADVKCPMLPEEQRQQLRKENEESKQRRAAQQQDQIHVNVGSEVDEIPTAIEDSVGNEDDDDKSIECVSFLQANGRVKLDEDKIYLNTCSSYNQMCTDVIANILSLGAATPEQ